MEAVGLVAKVVLAVVFAFAAASKLAAPTSFRRTLPLYGVPHRAVGVIAIAVPLAELAVAGAVIPRQLAPWGAVAALVLLAVFTGAAAVSRARGLEAECECFGPLDPLATGTRPFLRNIGLAATAALAAATGSDAATAGGYDSLVVGAAVVAAFASAWLAASARERRTRRAVVGSTAPAFVFRALTGESIRLAGSSDRPTLLLFWNPSCPPCQYMLPRLKAWEEDRPPGSPRLVIASSGSEQDNRAAGLVSPIVLEGSEEARRRFGIPGRPAAVLVGADGRVASEALLGAPAILAALGAPP
jgi:thiol-disulfide isomerase/thioredoxin